MTISSTETREQYLHALCLAKDFTSFETALRYYLFLRLQVPYTTRENHLYRLVVYSVKLKMPGVDAQRLEERLATTDCHQTSYVVSRKNLLMMEIECALCIKLSPTALDNIRTIEDYALALWEAKTT